MAISLFVHPTGKPIENAYVKASTGSFATSRCFSGGSCITSQHPGVGSTESNRSGPFTVDAKRPKGKRHTADNGSSKDNGRIAMKDRDITYIGTSRAIVTAMLSHAGLWPRRLYALGRLLSQFGKVTIPQMVAEY